MAANSALLRTPVTLLCVGCFNPVTNKHLRIMELARDALNKTGRFKVVSGVLSPAHDKYPKEGLVHISHRAAMLQSAVRNSDWIRVDMWESEQSDWTPTQCVLQKLRKRLREHLDNETGPSSKRLKTAGVKETVRNMNIRLVCGADLLESFSVPGLWKSEHIESIVKDFGLVVINREGANPQKFIYESDVLAKYADNIHLVTDWFGDDFSSTKVRRAVRRGESIKYVVQDSVLDYIRKHNLYMDDSSMSADTSCKSQILDLQLTPAMQASSSSGYFSAEPSPVDHIGGKTTPGQETIKEVNQSECGMTQNNLTTALYSKVRTKAAQNINSDRSLTWMDEEDDVRLRIFRRSETMPSPFKNAASSYERASVRSAASQSRIPQCTCIIPSKSWKSLQVSHWQQNPVRSQSFRVAPTCCPPALPPRAECGECIALSLLNNDTNFQQAEIKSLSCSDPPYSTVSKSTALDRLISSMKKLKLKQHRKKEIQ